MVAHKNRTLIIGPFPEPITGLSVSNAALLRGLQVKGYQVDFINTEHATNVSSELGGNSVLKNSIFSSSIVRFIKFLRTTRFI
ncbi:hypothetical protein JCM19297_2747 [Nonlabens ulvanivorans]|nr:hypothetical protein [Nonlabens ulvanivorans]GAK88234.1 hypothetical protein JCM19297_2747 [Nonlabens ulvanivorans]